MQNPIRSIPDADNTDLFGWKPFHPSQIDPLPQAWPDRTPQNAGWGVAVYSSEDHADSNCLCALHAPVCLDKEDQRFLGAEQASNNTGELTAIAEALIWLRDECPGPKSVPAEIIYDSRYAADLTLGVTEPHANHELAQQCHSLYRQVSRSRPSHSNGLKDIQTHQVMTRLTNWPTRAVIIKSRLTPVVGPPPNGTR